MKIRITTEDILKAEQAIREGKTCSSNCPVSQTMNRLFPDDGRWHTGYDVTFTWMSNLHKRYTLSTNLKEQLQAMDKDRKNLSKYFMPGEYEILKF